MKNKKIAIIGGGGLGTCTALELSARGYRVDLFEEKDELVTKASFANEGKIHLGLIYAVDKTLATAKEMVHGALHFMTYLRRWIDMDPEKIVSTPFYYLNHRTSLMTGTELGHHYSECQRLFNEGTEHFGLKYLDMFEELPIERIKEIEAAGFDSESAESVFFTGEYAVDIRKIAEALRAAVHTDDRIQVLTNHSVQAVHKAGNDLEIRGNNESGPFAEKYDEVINVAWNGRLAIDQTMNIRPPYQWTHRYKLANRVPGRYSSEDFPSVTIVQGPYGDTVNFRENGMFFSWYPIGRIGWSEALRPLEYDDIFEPEFRMKIAVDSLEELKKIVRSLNHIPIDYSQIDPVGGVIYALGNKEVDKIESRLHTRYEVGLETHGNYHTVNTGKYTIIPTLAMKIADRIDQ